MESNEERQANNKKAEYSGKRREKQETRYAKHREHRKRTLSKQNESKRQWKEAVERRFLKLSP